MAFNNYKNPSSVFDSFNGTELKCYMKVTTKYDEYGQGVKYELVEMGTISAISGAEQYATEPIPAIGFSRPIGIAVGSSIVSGSLAFETLKEGFVNDVKRILKEAGIQRISVADAEIEGELALAYEDIEEINDFPLVDIVILGVKENDMDKKIQKEIQGVRFNSGGSGISVNQLGVREQFSYIAQKMTDFKPVEGVKEDGYGDEEDVYEDSIFG